MMMFDISQYYPVPNLDTESFLTLCEVTLAHAPEPAPALVNLAAGNLGSVVDETRAALLDRFEEELGNRRLRAFDPFTDVVWTGVEAILDVRAMYLHPGTVELDDADREAVDFDRRAELARKAVAVKDKLFSGGREFLAGSYTTQLQHMDTRLTWLVKHADELELPALLGDELLTLVQRCQARYADLVHQRGAQTGKSAVDLRELRGKLRRQLYNYMGALGGMASSGDPATVAAVEDALRPVVVARDYSRRVDSGARDEAPEPLGEVFEQVFGASGGASPASDPSEEITAPGVELEPGE